MACTKISYIWIQFWALSVFLRLFVFCNGRFRAIHTVFETLKISELIPNRKRSADRFYGERHVPSEWKFVSVSVFAAHTFVCWSVLQYFFGNDHSSVSHSSLFLQLFVKKRNRLCEIMLVSSFRTSFLLMNVKWYHSKFYVGWRGMLQKFCQWLVL